MKEGAALLLALKLSIVFPVVQSSVPCASVVAPVFSLCTAQQIPPHGFSTSAAVRDALIDKAPFLYRPNVIELRIRRYQEPAKH